MRALSKWEKDVIDKLCDKPQFLSNFYSKKLLEDTILELTDDPYTGVIGLDMNIKNIEIGREAYKLMEITEATARLASFLNYLERENYIFKFIPAHGRQVKGTIGLPHVIDEFKTSPNSFMKIKFPDERFMIYILKNINFIFQCNQALIEYKKQNYRTPEQIRHNQNIWIAVVAIGASIAIGLAGFLSSINISDACECY